MKTQLDKERKDKAREILAQVKVVSAFKDAKRYNAEDAAFAVADLDGNSLIDFEEFCKLEANEGQSEDKLKALFQEFDVDESGQLDLQEFSAYLKKTGGLLPKTKWYDLCRVKVLCECKNKLMTRAIHHDQGEAEAAPSRWRVEISGWEIDWFAGIE